MSRITIFAALRVVPPDFMLPAQRSKPSRNERTPDDAPPPDSSSRFARILLKFVPVPLPYLKRRTSAFCNSSMESSESSTLWIKHAEFCGCSYAFVVVRTLCVARSQKKLPPPPSIPYSCQSPQLNQTGELNAPRCEISRIG